MCQTEEQSGFRTDRSTTDNIVCITQIIEKMIYGLRNHISRLLTEQKPMPTFSNSKLSNLQLT